MNNFFLEFKNKISQFDLFELGNSAIIYYFAIFYSVPILGYFDVLKNISHQTFYLKGFLYVTIGLIFLILGCMAGSSLSFKPSKFLRRDWDFKKAWWLFWFIFSLGLIVKLVRVIGGGYSHFNQNPLFLKSYYYSLMGNFDWLSYISLIIAFTSYFYLKKNNDINYKKWRIAAWMAFSFELIYAIPACTRIFAIVPIILYLIVKWYIYEKRYLKVIGILFFSIIILFPFGGICRLPAYTNISRSWVIQSVTGNDSSQPILIAAVNSGDYAVSSFLWRINQSVVISGILKNPQPFLHGVTFKELIFTFGPPRFFWKNKPVSMNANGNDFGHRIGILSDNDLKTSVGPTFIGDWYLNFGLIGIIIGMFLMGIIFRSIYQYLIKQTSHSLSGVMFYAVIWIQIIKGMEDWIAPVYVGVFRTLLILLIINFLLVKKNPAMIIK